MDRARAGIQANQLTQQLPPRWNSPITEQPDPLFHRRTYTHISSAPNSRAREYALLTWFITPGWSEMTPMLFEAHQSWVGWRHKIVGLPAVLAHGLDAVVEDVGEFGL
jgi:hypothetical protein